MSQTITDELNHNKEDDDGHQPDKPARKHNHFLEAQEGEKWGDDGGHRQTKEETTSP